MSRSFFTKAVLIAVILIMGSLGFVPSSYAVEHIPVIVDGVELNIDPGYGQPTIINNRTLVPLRAVSEALGVQVDWDDTNRRVLITTNEAITGNNFVINSSATSSIPIFVNGIELKIAPEYGQAIIINNRTMVPLRAVSEALGVKVDWDDVNGRVIITTDNEVIGSDVAIFGQSAATSAQLKALLAANNPDAPDLVDLYLSIGREYGIRGDIAFCQAAKETGWWRFGGIVQPGQNNYCGLWATGAPNTGLEDLHGADSTRVWFVQGSYGAYFDSPATGVEAQIQHLYAYACTKDLPAGKVLLDPRFALVKKGCAPNWVDLGGKWAVPGYNRSKYASFEEAFANGETYGQSILTDYYAKALKY